MVFLIIYDSDQNLRMRSLLVNFEMSDKFFNCAADDANNSQMI